MFNLKGKFAAMIAAATLATPATVQAEEFINILTGGTSGVYYPLGVGLSKIYADNIDGARTQVQSTKASVENLNLLQQGKGELALALGDSVKLAWKAMPRRASPNRLASCGALRRSIRTISRSWHRRNRA